MDADQLLQEALRLPVEARAKLVGDLIYSLDDAPPDTDRDVAWAIEIRRRLAAYDAGELHSVPGDDLLRDLRTIASGGGTRGT
ncbi:MAG: addiction module protein [Polyangiaceae bacterium]|nr:addiction module protein [Polyangiaceae bacterium]MCL4749676.1 addiction module protein [Myxococcales bacterium]